MEKKIVQVIDSILSVIGFDRYVLDKLTTSLEEKSIIKFIHCLLNFYTTKVDVWKSCLIFTYKNEKFAICEDRKDILELEKNGVIDEGVLVNEILPIILRKVFEKTVNFIDDVINSKKAIYDVIEDLLSFKTRMSILFKTFEKMYVSKDIKKVKIETLISKEVRQLMDYICHDILQIYTLEKCISFMTWYIAKDISENLDKKIKVLREIKEIEKEEEIKKLKLY